MTAYMFSAQLKLFDMLQTDWLTLFEFVILLTLAWQQRLRERASMFRLHVYCLPCIYLAVCRYVT
jgi:hypothetical protein